MRPKWLLWASFFSMTSIGIFSVQAATIVVTITDLEFSPAVIDSKVGDTITWKNNDIMDHTATVKGGWDVIIPAKESASLVVKAPEVSEYYCRYHPNMVGNITVTSE